MALNKKQQRFVEEYVIDFNATQAAIRAGYSEDSAADIGHENLRKPEIAKAVEAKKAELRDKAGLSAGMVIDELRSLAFWNVVRRREQPHPETDRPVARQHPAGAGSR